MIPEVILGLSLNDAHKEPNGGTGSVPAIQVPGNAQARSHFLIALVVNAEKNQWVLRLRASFTYELTTIKLPY